MSNVSRTIKLYITNIYLLWAERFCPHNSYVRPNPLNGVWRQGLWKGLGHEDRALKNEIKTLIKKRPHKNPCEITENSCLSNNQEVGSPQTPNLPVPRPCTSGLRRGGKYTSVVCNSPSLWCFVIVAQKD